LDQPHSGHGPQHPTDAPHHAEVKHAAARGHGHEPASAEPVHTAQPSHSQQGHHSEPAHQSGHGHHPSEPPHPSHADQAGQVHPAHEPGPLVVADPPDMSKFLVHNDGMTVDPVDFHRHAGNDLFNFSGDAGGHGMVHGASWTNAVELDIHGSDAGASHSAGWTHQVENHVVVIDNHHQDSASNHISSSGGDPAHDHIDKIHW
jgi:hypothetical protein